MIITAKIIIKNEIYLYFLHLIVKKTHFID